MPSAREATHPCSAEMERRGGVALDGLTNGRAWVDEASEVEVSRGAACRAVPVPTRHVRFRAMHVLPQGFPFLQF